MANVTDVEVRKKNINREFTNLLNLLLLLPTLKGFLGFVPLTVGIIVLTFYYWMTAVCSLTANVLKINPDMSLSCLLMLTVNICLCVIWAFAASGVMIENSFHIKIALIMWTVFVISWSLFVLSTFSNYGVIFVCLQNLCPESFWMYNNTWHQVEEYAPVLRPHSPKDDVFQVFAQKAVSSNDWNSTRSDLTNIASMAAADRPTANATTFKKLRAQLEHGKETPKILINDESANEISIFRHTFTQFLIFVLMTIINSAVIYYSWFILFSHYFEVKCIEKCRCLEEVQNVTDLFKESNDTKKKTANRNNSSQEVDEKKTSKNIDG